MALQASSEITAIPGLQGGELSRHGSTLGHDLGKTQQAPLAIRKEAVAVLDLLLNATLQMEVVDLEALHYVQVRRLISVTPCASSCLLLCTEYLDKMKSIGLQSSPKLASPKLASVSCNACCSRQMQMAGHLDGDSWEFHEVSWHSGPEICTNAAPLLLGLHVTAAPQGWWPRPFSLAAVELHVNALAFGHPGLAGRFKIVCISCLAPGNQSADTWLLNAVPMCILRGRSACFSTARK